MDTKLLFIRHGHSEATDIYLPGRMPGVHLSQTGNEQAAQLARDLDKFKIDRIFSSPLERAVETAEYISSAKKIKLEIMDGLLEINFGGWSGKSFEELKKLEDWTKFNYFRTNTRPPEGETILEVQARVVAAIDKVFKADPGKTFAFVSHGDCIRAAIAYYTGLHPDLMSRIKIHNAAVSVLKIHDWDCELQCLNYRSDILKTFID
jgi:probable phosphoglycerate mutase